MSPEERIAEKFCELMGYRQDYEVLEARRQFAWFQACIEEWEREKLPPLAASVSQDERLINSSIVQSPTCEKCGEPAYTHPRLGIYHKCSGGHAPGCASLYMHGPEKLRCDCDASEGKK